MATKFDPEYYQARYPDIPEAGVDPLDHYCLVGWHEGRDPSCDFSTNYYLDTNRDVRETDMNPLLHFVIAGEREGRRPLAPEAPESLPELPLLTLEEEIAEWLYPSGTTGLPSRPRDESTTLEHDDAETVKQVLAWNGRAEAVRQAEQLTYRPLISILIPTFNTHPDVLADTVKSILSQSYSKWELIIVDDGSTSAMLSTFLSELTSWDDRISVTRLPTNAGISAATNEALEHARGEYIALIDHDDLVLPDALLAVVCELNEEPSIDVVYTDQEYGDADGAPEEPLVKPDWDPYLFLGVMYVGHLLVARRELAITAGGFDSNFDNVQDFEFMLRLSEHTNRIRHVPSIQYRWRRVPGSVAARGDAKADIESLQTAAVSAHLRRRGLAASARPHPHLAHRAQLIPARAKPLSFSLIVGPANNADAIAATVQAHLSSAPVPLSVVLWGVEGGRVMDIPSTDALDVRAVDSLTDAIACARGEMVLFLEPGLVPATEGWFEQLQFYAQLDDVACASGVVVNPAGLVDEAGLMIGVDGVITAALTGRAADSDGYAGSLSCTRTVSAVSGRSVMVKREVLVALDGLSRHYDDAQHSWIDFSFRAAQGGLRCLVAPLARFICQVTTDPPAVTSRDLLLLRDRWARRLDAGDPYYSRSLSSYDFEN